MEKIKSSDLLTILASTIITLAVALGAVRYFAPQLLGIASDIQMVKTSKKVPPFFDGVFREEDYSSEDFILPDPIIKRAKPLFPDIGGMGPNDILGFRNYNVPNATDVIIIGDSQTYGNNATIENNWPNQFVKELEGKNKNITHYDMAVGAWGAIEYLEIFYKSAAFNPRMVIIAFYSGNDPLGSFTTAYSNKRWKDYRVDKSLSSSDLPKVEFPPPESDQWKVKFKDNSHTIFTPKYRLYSNDKNKVVKAGYEIMLLVAKEIAKICRENNISIVYTVIPTKELVYQKKIENEGIDVPDNYKNLVENEYEYIKWLKSEIMYIEGVQYINLVEAMQEKAMLSVPLYPNDGNGHPIAVGYKVIAEQLADNVEIKWEIPEGLVALFTDKKSYQLGLVRDGNYWVFSSTETIEANGWNPNIVPATIKPRDIVNLKKLGLISTIDQNKYGPR